MMTFNELIHRYKVKNKAISKKKNYQIPSSVGLDNVDKYLTDGSFEFDIVIGHFHDYFDSYGCSPPQKPSKFFYKLERT